MIAAGWNPVKTMPLDRKVLVKTIKGLERVARRSTGWPVRPYLGTEIQTLHCWRADGHSGDLTAIGWKELK